VLDYSYSPEYELETTLLQTKLMKLPRKAFFALQKEWTVRILGGCSSWSWQSEAVHCCRSFDNESDLLLMFGEKEQPSCSFRNQISTR